MKTITILSQKGGSGKTTIAENLAVAAEEAGYRSILLDIDPQASAMQWGQVRAAKIARMPAVIPTHPAAIAGVLEEARAQGVAFAFIDTAPHANTQAVDAARVGDLVLVPSKATVTDLRALGNTLQVCKLADATAHVVLTMIEPSARFLDEARATLQNLARTYPLVTLPVGVGQRVAFHYAQIDGRSVLEYDPEGKAAAEIRTLFEHVRLLAFKNSIRSSSHVRETTAA
jgi:chromosome partitioning protein